MCADGPGVRVREGECRTFRAGRGGARCALVEELTHISGRGSQLGWAAVLTEGSGHIYEQGTPASPAGSGEVT